MRVELSSYIMAGFPALYIDTAEDDRAMAMIKKEVEKVQTMVEESSNFYVWAWKSTTGLLNEIGSPVQAADIKSAFDVLGTDSRRVVAVFFNAIKYLVQPLVLQAAKDAILRCRKEGSHIIFVGPGYDFPSELTPFITYVDFPLPDKASLADLFDNIVTSSELPIDRKSSAYRFILDKAAESALGLTEIEAENAISLSIIEKDAIDIGMIQAEKTQAIKKSGILEIMDVSETIDDLGDFDLLIEWVRKRAGAFSDEAREYPLPVPKGIVVIGPPGTGKTLTAKVIASYLEMPLIKFDIGSLFRKYVGESEEMVRRALRTIETVSPIVVLFDELDKGFAGLSSSGSADSGVTARVISTILTWMQERTCPAFCVATVNRIEGIPPEVYRAGRFDAVFAADLPQTNGRKEIFEIHLRKRNRDPSKFNLRLLAAASAGFVGSEIEAVIQEAMFTAFADGGREVTTEDILAEIKQFYPQSVADKEKISAIRKFCADRAKPVSTSAKSKASEGGEVKMRRVKHKIKTGTGGSIDGA